MANTFSFGGTPNTSFGSLTSTSQRSMMYDVSNALPTNSHYEDSQGNVQHDGGPDAASRLPTSNGFRPGWKAKWVRTGGILLIVMLLIGLAVHITDMSKSWCSVQLPECTYAGSLTGLTDVVPLPHNVNQIAHKPILDKLHDFEKLPSLTSTRSSLYASVKTTNRELTKRLACALKSYSRVNSNDKKAGFTLLNDIILVYEQTNHTVSNASRLYDLYSSIEPAYHQHNLTVAKALEAIQLDDRRVFLVSAQPLISKWLGFDYKEMYWDPWIEKEAKLEEVKSGIVALEKELGRLEKIEQVTQKLSRNLEHLAITLVMKDTKFTRDSDNLLRQGYALLKKGREQQLEGGGSREKRLKDWFRRHVVQYNDQDGASLTKSQFDMWWTNLDFCCEA